MHSQNLWCPHHQCTPQSIRRYCIKKSCPQYIDPFIDLHYHLQEVCQESCNWNDYFECFRSVVENYSKAYGTYINRWYQLNIAKQYHKYMQYMIDRNLKYCKTSNNCENMCNCDKKNCSCFHDNNCYQESYGDCEEIDNRRHKCNVLTQTHCYESVANIGNHIQRKKAISYDIIFPKKNSKVESVKSAQPGYCKKHSLVFDVILPKKTKASSILINTGTQCYKSMENNTNTEHSKFSTSNGTSESKTCILNEFETKCSNLRTELMQIKSALSDLQDYINTPVTNKHHNCIGYENTIAQRQDMSCVPSSSTRTSCSTPYKYYCTDKSQQLDHLMKKWIKNKKNFEVERSEENSLCNRNSAWTNNVNEDKDVWKYNCYEQQYKKGNIYQSNLEISIKPSHSCPDVNSKETTSEIIPFNAVAKYNDVSPRSSNSNEIINRNSNNNTKGTLKISFDKVKSSCFKYSHFDCHASDSDKIIISKSNSIFNFHLADEIIMKSSQTFCIQSKVKKTNNIFIPYPKTDFSTYVYKES